MYNNIQSSRNGLLRQSQIQLEPSLVRPPIQLREQSPYRCPQRRLKLINRNRELFFISQVHRVRDVRRSVPHAQQHHLRRRGHELADDHPGVRADDAFVPRELAQGVENAVGVAFPGYVDQLTGAGPGPVE